MTDIVPMGDLLPAEQTRITRTLESFLSASNPDEKMDAVQTFLLAVTNYEKDSPQRLMGPMYELAIYKYASLIDELSVDKDKHKAKIGTINQFMKNYFARAGYDVEKMFQ